jgi:hypothetical protein
MRKRNRKGTTEEEKEKEFFLYSFLKTYPKKHFFKTSFMENIY